MDSWQQCLVNIDEAGTYYFTANCCFYGGASCPQTVHLWWPSSESQSLVMRHGEGEARRDFTFDEWASRGTVESWLKSVHAYEQ